MEIRRKIVDRKIHTISSTAKYFRRALYGLIGVVLSAYVVLFILVVSRHIDQSAQKEMQRALVEESKGKAKARRPVGLVSGLGPSLLGMDRFQERWAAVARVLNTNELRMPRVRRRIHVCMQPKFRNPPGPMTALASFPGSGNTWIRFLLQQATGQHIKHCLVGVDFFPIDGMCSGKCRLMRPVSNGPGYLTGSVYRDYSLKRNGFPAENIANGSVLLVKTHEWGESTRLKFQKAVLLIRDPYGALVAEFNRRAGGHVGHASPEKFHKGNAWSSFVQTHSRLWMESVLDWLQFQGPLLVARYEFIIEDLPSQLIRLLKFLDMNISWNAFQCVLRNRDGIFRRAKKQLNFELFDDSLRKVVDTYKGVVEMALQYHEQGIKFDLSNTTLSQEGDGSNSNLSLIPVTYVDKEQNNSS